MLSLCKAAIVSVLILVGRIHFRTAENLGAFVRRAWKGFGAA